MKQLQQCHSNCSTQVQFYLYKNISQRLYCSSS